MYRKIVFYKRKMGMKKYYCSQANTSYVKKK